MTRQELLSSEEYWLTDIQFDLFNAVVLYGQSNDIEGDALREYLGLSNRKFRQLIAGEFNGSIEEVVRIALKVGMATKVEFLPLSEYE